MISLPSLRDLDRPRGDASSGFAPRIWLAVGHTDMRRGFDRLAELVASVVGQDPRSGHLFLFRSRSGDRLKILSWDRDGYALWYKRLEEGTFRLPKADAGAASIELKPSDLAMLLDGIDLRSVRRVKRYRAP